MRNELLCYRGDNYMVIFAASPLLSAGPQSDFRTTVQQVCTSTKELEYCNQEGQYQIVRSCPSHGKCGTESVHLEECEASGTKPQPMISSRARIFYHLHHCDHT